MNIHLKELEKKLQYEFHDKNLFSQALTHSSYANEHRLDHSRCNERLEFLGDAVLEIVTSDFLYHKYDALPEGDSTKIRQVLSANPLWHTVQEISGWASTCSLEREKRQLEGETAILWYRMRWKP